MKKLTLLFIGLIGCAHQSNVVATKDTVEIIVRRIMGPQTIVDYKVAQPSNQELTSQAGQALVLQLQGQAMKKARDVCTANGKDTMFVSQVAKQENGEISGRTVALCVEKEQEK